MHMINDDRGLVTQLANYLQNPKNYQDRASARVTIGDAVIDDNPLFAAILEEAINRARQAGAQDLLPVDLSLRCGPILISATSQLGLVEVVTGKDRGQFLESINFTCPTLEVDGLKDLFVGELNGANAQLQWDKGYSLAKLVVDGRVELAAPSLAPFIRNYASIAVEQPVLS